MVANAKILLALPLGLHPRYFSSTGIRAFKTFGADEVVELSGREENIVLKSLKSFV